MHFQSWAPAAGAQSVGVLSCTMASIGAGKVSEPPTAVVEAQVAELD
jgi:hypothetical protein